MPRKFIVPTERLVLAELCRDGADNYQIAQRLGYEVGTIKWYVAQLMRKSDTANRTALALWWIREGRYRYPEDDECAA